MTIVTMKTVNLIDTNVSGSTIVRSFWKAWKIRNHRRKSVRHLRSMPDHLLKDLGIHRTEICSLVNGMSTGSKYMGV